MVKLPARGLEAATALVGFALVVGGTAAWSRPAGMVVAGALLLVGALWRTK